MSFLERPRRLRRTSLIRNLIHEVNISKENLIQPYFVTDSKQNKTAIPNFTDVYLWNVDSLSKEIERDCELGIKSFLLFPSSPKKELSYALDPRNLGAEVLRKLKERFANEALFFIDVCLCPYNPTGHCGIVENKEVINDKSVEVLSQMSVVFAEAGADFVAPSDMMDGRVSMIRKKLDEQGYTHTGILAYTAKYASQYYGPFRNALDSSPQNFNRCSYQMDFRNSKEALRELKLDEDEGADIVMVKPALNYLDIIYLFSKNTSLPVAAYSVSSEYEMVKCLSRAGLCEEREMVLENLTAIKRAGADLIISYYASECLQKRWL